MDPQRVLAALAEPTRFRIVELLNSAPRTVGEVADVLGARQPQTTKHLQALASAEVITVHRLGRRRVASLRRDTLRDLTRWLDRLATPHPSETVLEEYATAIDAERARAASGLPGDRTINLRRNLPAAAEDVWDAWTQPRLIRRWWAPDHFEVADCEIDATVGGAFRIVLREGDGAEHRAVGTILEVQPPRRLRMSLSPLGPDGSALFATSLTLSLRRRAGTTALHLTIDVTDVAPDALPALAGLELGWRQTIERLTTMLESDRR